jgi:hypothetical protein
MHAWLSAPFLSNGRLDLGIVSLFLLINSLVFINASLHNPESAYDVYGHMGYVKALNTEYRMPTPKESYEFFSPPLPYLIPAIFQNLTNFLTTNVAKFGQYVNGVVSVLLTYFFLRLGYVMSPTEPSVRRTSLLLLGMLPVYYKTLAMGVRGEPYVALFAILSVYMLVTIIFSRSQNLWRFDLLGVFLGLAILSRQWGFLIYPAIFGTLFLLIIRSEQRAKLLHGALLTILIATVVGGWFYYHLKLEYHEFTAFNMEQTYPVDYSKYVEQNSDLMAFYNDKVLGKMSLSEWGEKHYIEHGQYNETRVVPRASVFKNHSREFYLGTGDGQLFTNPVRDQFPYQFFPIMYTEIWGDYFAFFQYSNRITQKGDPEIVAKLIAARAPYLGRVNLVSFMPSLFLFCGFLYGLSQLFRAISLREADRTVLCNGLYAAVILGTMIGYIWYVLTIIDPTGLGGSIKGVYIFHAFPFIAILGSQLFVIMKRHSTSIYRFSIVLLLAVVIHNTSAMITNVRQDAPLERYWLPDLDIPGVYD